MPRPIFLYGLAIAVALFFGAMLERHVLSRTDAETQLRPLIHTERTLDIRYVHDTVVLHDDIKRYNNARDQVLAHPTDPLVVQTYVHLADTVVAACTEVIQTCEERLKNKDKIISLLEKTQPTFWDRFGVTTGPAVVVQPNGRVGWGWQVGFAIKVWP